MSRSIQTKIEFPLNDLKDRRSLKKGRQKNRSVPKTSHNASNWKKSHLSVMWRCRCLSAVVSVLLAPSILDFKCFGLGKVGGRVAGSPRVAVFSDVSWMCGYACGQIASDPRPHCFGAIWYQSLPLGALIHNGYQHYALLPARRVKKTCEIDVRSLSLVVLLPMFAVSG